MFRRILQESIHEVTTHPMLIRIAFLTGFVHTLGSFWSFWWTLYYVTKKSIDISSIEGNLWEYFKAIFEIISNHLTFGTTVGIIIAFIIGYVFLYTIWHGLMVSYTQSHSLTKALKNAFWRYFTVTITEWILAAVTFWSRHIWSMRYLYYRGILWNILVIILLVLIGMFVTICTFLYTYGNIASVTDEFASRRPYEQSWEAIKNSSKIAVAHPFTTLKFMALSLILELRFFITTVFVIGIPSFLVWFALQLGLIWQERAVNVVMIVIGILLVISIYINSIIDAFFTVYRYKLYTELKVTTEE